MHPVMSINLDETRNVSQVTILDQWKRVVRRLRKFVKFFGKVYENTEDVVRKFSRNKKVKKKTLSIYFEELSWNFFLF